MKKIFLVFLILSSQNLHAQNRDSLLQVANSGKADTNTVKAMRALAGLSDASKTMEAIRFGLKGVELGKKINWPKGIAGCYLNIGTQYDYLGKFDSVLYYADSAIKYSYLAGDPNRLALVYLNKADGYMQLHAFAKTLTLCDSAMKYAEAANSNDRRARIFQTIGAVYFFQEVYDKALVYDKRSAEMYGADRNEKMVAIVVCNIGNIFDNLEQYDSAVFYYAKAIEAGERLKDYNQLPLYYGSMGETLINKNEFKEAVEYSEKALSIAIQQQQLQHISIGNIRLAGLYYKLKDYPRSISYALEGYKAAKETEDVSDQRLAAEQLAKSYSQLGDHKNAFNWMETNKNLSDSLNKMQFDEDIIAKQTVFEVSQKENQIKLLSSEKDIREKDIQKKKLLISLLVVALIALVSIGLILWNRYRLKQQLKEVQIRNKIASDLHDDVGATLSSIRMYSNIVSNQVKETNPQSTELLDKISTNSKEMIENMSDIVWMIKPGNDDFKSIENRMLNFANELCVPAGINFEFTKQGPVENFKMPMEQRRDVYLIFKEAINNAVKYSACKSISANISMDANHFQMTISDDGIGFDTNIISNGNGLSNMKKRVEANHGNFEIKSAPGEGTEIIVSFAG